MAVNSNLPRGRCTGGAQPHTRFPIPYSRFLLFLTGEAIILSLFVYIQIAGYGLLGTAVLFVPFQILLWAILIQDEFWLLIGFAAVFPLSTLELLPYAYWRWIFYPVHLLLFFILMVERTILRGMGHRAGKMESLFPIRYLLSPILFGVWIILSSFHAFTSGLVLRENLLLLYTTLGLMTVGVIFFFALVPKSLKQIKVLISILAGSYTLSVLFLPLLKFLPWEPLGGKTLLAPFGGYVNMNVVAGHVACATLLLLGLLLSVRNFAGKLFGFFGVLILLAVLIITRSRGAWLGFGVGLLYLLARTRSKGLLVVTVLGLLILSSLELFRSTFLRRLTETSLADPSLAGRAVLWTYALRVFKHNWFWGVGIQNYRFAKHIYGFPAPLAQARQYDANNFYLEILADLGVIGLILFLGMLFGVFIGVEKILRSRFKRVNGERHTYAGGAEEYLGVVAGVQGTLVAYAVHGLWDSIFWQHGAFILLGVILGLGIAVYRVMSNSLPVVKSCPPPFPS